MRSLTRPLVRSGLVLLLAVLGLYHLWLLGGRLADGSVLEPLVAGRWLGSLALIGVFVALRRRGFSVSRGRSALVFWLLVTLLHGVGAVGWTVEAPVEGPPLPAGVLWVATPLGLAVTAFFWAGAIAARRRVRRAPDAISRSRLRPASRSARSALLLAAIGPRAPPVF